MTPKAGIEGAAVSANGSLLALSVNYGTKPGAILRLAVRVLP